MTEQQEGYYHCHGCGKYFKGSGGGTQSCSHCNMSQVSLGVWDDVIRKRYQGMSFQKAKRVDNDFKEGRGSSVIDVASRRKEKLRQGGVLLGLMWVVGMSFYIYQKSEKNDPKAETEIVIDGSISSKEYSRLNKEAQKCVNALNNFIRSSDNLASLKYIAQPDFDMVETFYEVGGKPNRPVPSQATKFRISDDKANLVFIAPNKEMREAAFVKKEGEWLLDWQAYVNYSTMPLSYFLEEQPEEDHDFRLLFTHNKYGVKTALNLFEYNRNSAIINGFTGRKVTITLDSNHPCVEKVNKVVKATENYLKYNNMLSDIQAGCFGLEDPLEHYRIRVTLAFENNKGVKQLVLKDVKGAHWLGDYYKELLRPEQELLLDQ